MMPRTVHNMDALVCISAMQKAIRRGLEEEAMQFAVELLHTSLQGFQQGRGRARDARIRLRSRAQRTSDSGRVPSRSDGRSWQAGSERITSLKSCRRAKALTMRGNFRKASLRDRLDLNSF